MIALCMKLLLYRIERVAIVPIHGHYYIVIHIYPIIGLSNFRYTYTLLSIYIILFMVHYPYTRLFIYKYFITFLYIHNIAHYRISWLLTCRIYKSGFYYA